MIERTSHKTYGTSIAIKQPLRFFRIEITKPSFIFSYSNFKVSCHFVLSLQTIHRCFAVLNYNNDLVTT